MYDAEWKEEDEERTGLGEGGTGVDVRDPASWGLDDRLGGQGWASMDVDRAKGGQHYEGAEYNVGGEYYPPGGMYGDIYGARGRGAV